MRVVAKHAPLLLFLDDLQWADPGSLGLLFSLGRRLSGHRILIVGAYRPEELPTSADGSPRAAPFLEKANKRLQERAALISDEAMRQSFLENIAWHREIVALWEEQRLRS